MNQAPFRSAYISVHGEQPYHMCLKQLSPGEVQMGFTLS